MAKKILPDPICRLFVLALKSFMINAKHKMTGRLLYMDEETIEALPDGIDYIDSHCSNKVRKSYDYRTLKLIYRKHKTAFD